MVGLLMWKKRNRGEKTVTVEESTVLHMRFFKVEVARESGTPEVVLRRRVRGALRRLHKQGVTRVVLPEDFPYPELLEKQSLRPVSTLSLRRRLAADWVRTELVGCGLSLGSARVAVAADQLTGEVVRTVTELVLRHRHVLLDLPQGGEELCRQLRREYGVAVLLSPSREQMEEAEAVVLFDQRELESGGICLRLYEETQPLPALLLPPVLERQLPEGVDRTQLLSVLQEAGALKPGQITLEDSR